MLLIIYFKCNNYNIIQLLKIMIYTQILKQKYENRYTEVSIRVKIIQITRNKKNRY